MIVFLMHVFRMMTLDCLIFLIGHILLHIAFGFGILSLNGMIVSYIVLLFVLLAFNVRSVRRNQSYKRLTKILLILLNPADWLGFLALAAVILLWGNFQWQGFGF